MDTHQEIYYLNADVGPIAAIAAAGLIGPIIYWISECCFLACCRSTETQLLQQPREENQCSMNCICEHCNGWKCWPINCPCRVCHPETCWEGDCKDCCTRQNCCKQIVWLVSELVKLMYGDEFYLIKEKEESDEVHTSGRIKTYIGIRLVNPRAKCLNFFLGSMAILLMTFLAMVFADIFFVKSYPGCQPGLDCYKNDVEFQENPIIDNCSEYLRLNIPTICYSLELSFQPAFSAVGGILIMSRLLVVGFAKLMISCTSKFLRSKCCDSKYYGSTKCCGKIWLAQFKITMIQFIVAGAFLVIAIGVLTGTTLKSHDKPTQFRLIGYIIQYITVGLSVWLTIVAPLYHLIRCQCESLDQISPVSTATTEKRYSKVEILNSEKKATSGLTEPLLEGNDEDKKE